MKCINPSCDNGKIHQSHPDPSVYGYVETTCIFCCGTGVMQGIEVSPLPSPPPPLHRDLEGIRAAAQRHVFAPNDEVVLALVEEALALRARQPSPETIALLHARLGAPTTPLEHQAATWLALFHKDLLETP